MSVFEETWSLRNISFSVYLFNQIKKQKSMTRILEIYDALLMIKDGMTLSQCTWSS